MYREPVVFVCDRGGGNQSAYFLKDKSTHKTTEP